MDLFDVTMPVVMKFNIPLMRILDDCDPTLPYTPDEYVDEFRKENFGMFDLMVVDIHDFSSVWSAPLAEWVTLESIAKMKKILTSDVIVVI
ncbi:hypothetical protein HanRHA438_Chr14g0671061 [Helianthus annuus]|nr:hypothetical protein HanPSC8_Chr14g0633271 [Helianthus annuus]KAJ0855225.1 hypothetical protein HanRHA438_Chr14g0671061 [Helianthus annuus]